MIIAPMLRSNSSSSSQLWLNRLLTLSLAALVAASGTFWVLHWPRATTLAPNTVEVAPPPRIDSAKVAMLLGAQTAAAQAPAIVPQTSFKLLGVITQGGGLANGTRGSALIAVDTALPKPYRVGDVVADDLVLQSVQTRSVVLGRSGQTQGSLKIDLPPPAGTPAKP